MGINITINPCSHRPLYPVSERISVSKGNRYSFSSAVFYLGFVFGSYPAILMLQRWPIERVVAGIVVAWGVCLMCSAACTDDYQSFYAQCFFLNFLESGVSPMFSKSLAYIESALPDSLIAHCRWMVQETRASS
jgi:fucose permease